MVKLLCTSLTKLLGIRHPIVQGGLNYVGSANLAAAVANAGGLGLITAKMRDPSAFREEIRSAKSMLVPNNKCLGALGANLTLLPETFPPSEDEDYVSVIIEEGITIVETSGVLEHKTLEKLQQNNVKIIHKCTNLCDAKKAEDMNVNVISLDGFECAGQPSEEEVGNWVLQAIGARELSIPYVASGGVGTGRQLAAALALGASGVSMGTRFLATQEANMIDDTLKKMLVERGVSRTAFQVHRTGDAESLRPHGVRLSVWSCGPVAALIDDIPTCSELMERMVADAVDVIEKLPEIVERQQS